MRNGVHDGFARNAPRGSRPGPSGGGARRPAPVHTLAPVRAACRLCGFPVHGFLNGTTCVLQVDGRALRESCCEAADVACRAQHACAGLQEAVRAARKPSRTP